MPTAAPLTPERWQRIEAVFHQALEAEPHSRSALLEHLCGTDSDLRGQVESLLSSSAAAEPLLETAVQQVAESYLTQRSPAPVAEGDCLDHYVVRGRIGAGGMGEVYLAEDSRLKRKVALKMLPAHLIRDPLALKRFEQEAQVLSGLNQPNLLTVFEFCHFEGRHFLVTEFIEGETLRQVLGRGALPRAQALDVAIQIAAALRAAHASGVIHRDIKPENIIIRPDGWVKVLDFGIAKLAEHLPGSGSGNYTVPGTILGTPRYMSPEQARATAVDARTDLFSLGAVLYEMLTGKAPFRGETHNDLIADILRAHPGPLPPGAPKSLQAILHRALAKDPAQRFQTAAELLVSLKQVRENEKPAHRRPVLLWTALGASIAVVAVAAWFSIAPSFRPLTQNAPRTLAVLPFRNLKPDPATDFLGVSLADEVTAKLGFVKALTVRASTSINKYRDGAPDPRQAASELNTNLLLTGTYLKDGDDLRITARLLGFHPDAVLWQDTLNIKYDKLLTVQDRVATLIIQGLELRLGPDERARLSPNAPVDKLAYEYYLRGVDLYTASNFSAAINMLEKSVAIDPNYAPTWAYLGRAYTTSGSLQFGGRDHYRRAEQAYEKAIALNPVFAEPRVYMANLFTDTGRVEESVPLLRVALQSSPNNAEAHWELGYAYRYGGMLEASVAECELARRLDPEVKINSATLNSYLYLGQYDRFLASIPANDSALLLFYHGFASYYKHNFTEARTDFDRAFELAPDLAQAQIGKALSDNQPARLHDTERKMAARGVIDPEAFYKIAQAYAVLGDSASALRMLRGSIVGGFFCYSYIARDPLLNPIRKLPEFTPLLEQANQRHLQFAKRFAPK